MCQTLSAIKMCHCKMINWLAQVLQIILQGLLSLLQDHLFKMIITMMVGQMDTLCMIKYLTIVVTFHQLGLLQWFMIVLWELLHHLLQPIMNINLYLLEQCLETRSSDLLTIPNLTRLIMETDMEMWWMLISHAVTLDVLHCHQIKLSLSPCLEN